jgi:predicted DNA-binding protein
MAIVLKGVSNGGMPNKYKEGTAHIYLRLPEEWKGRLYAVAKRLDKPATALVREWVIKKVVEIEEILKKDIDR